MAILKVARMGHPVLRAKARPVPPQAISSPAIQQLIDDMFETMHEYTGIGLAAPQVHECVRIFVAGVREIPVPPVTRRRPGDAVHGIDQPRSDVARPGDERGLGGLPEHPRHSRPRAARAARFRCAPTIAPGAASS